MIKETLMQRIQSLTSEDMQVLDDVLTPSITNVLKFMDVSSLKA